MSMTGVVASTSPTTEGICASVRISGLLETEDCFAEFRDAGLIPWHQLLWVLDMAILPCPGPHVAGVPCRICGTRSTVQGPQNQKRDRRVPRQTLKHNANSGV